MNVFVLGGGSEVQWSDNEPYEPSVMGFIEIFENGVAVFPFRHPETDEPYLFYMAGKDTRLVAGEDRSGTPLPDEEVVWKLVE